MASGKGRRWPDMADRGMIRNETLTPQDSLAANGRSFHWASRFLGEKMGHDAARLYALCRLLDDMADDDIPDGPARLACIEADLASGRTGNDPAFGAFHPFMIEMGFSPAVLSALIEGLLQDQADEVRLDDEAALLRYAYRVAGTVGLMMCDVLDCGDANAKSHAIDLGIGMQLTNIARDILEDARMGRRYLPGTWVNNMSPAAICTAADAPTGADSQQIAIAVERLLLLAEQFYQSGARGYAYLPWRAHLGIAVAARVYRQIGVQLSTSGFAWYRGRQVTSRSTKIRCSVLALGSLFARALPSHDTGHDGSLHHALQGLPHVS